jgi:hypothetical protein
MDALTFLLERPTADYTMVCNAVLRDRSISLRGKGLYALVFSKPSGWIFHEKALPAESTEGRDALRAAMKELLTARWVQKCQRLRADMPKVSATVLWYTLDISPEPIPRPPRDVWGFGNRGASA